jgi:glycosyltransferase involved in cell wall biosynthesis
VRIVYLTGYWPPARYASGILSAIDNLRPALESLGHEVRIVAMNGERSSDDHNVAYVRESLTTPRPLAAVLNRMPSRWRHFELAPRRAAVALADAMGDVLEMEESNGWVSIVAARTPLPIVMRLHGPYFLTGAPETGGAYSAFDRERLRRERRAFADAPFISAPSRFVLSEVRRHTGLTLANAAVVPNAAPNMAPELCWRRDAADRDHVLYVGRFDKIKGADIALAAFAAAARSRPNLRLTFVGDTKGRTLEYQGARLDFDAYVAAAFGPDIARRVTNAGRLPLTEVFALRAHASVVVISSRIEMFPLAALEAAAAGAPIAACAVGGVPEILNDGEEALLTPPENAEALGAAIGMLADDRDLAARLGASAQGRAARDFAPGTVARAALSVYEQAIALNRAQRRTARGA